MKSLFGIILLSALILPFLGAYALLKLEKAELRKDVKWKMIEGIDKTELELLCFSIEQTKTELNWKHSHEFEFMGMMYDIVETIQTSDSIHYYCWLDHEETALNKRLDHVFYSFFGTGAPSKQKEARVAYFLRTLFLIDQNFNDLFDPYSHQPLGGSKKEELTSIFLNGMEYPPECDFKLC